MEPVDSAEVNRLMPVPSISNPQAFADRGESIYREKYKERYEEAHHGQFVAIDVGTEEAYVGESPVEALIKARDADPAALFHLIKVGSAGAFRVSHTSNAANHWFPSRIR